MKRALTAAAIGLVVFSGVYGFAASLSVTSDSLGAGSSAVAACQAAALNVTYAPSYQSAMPGYERPPSRSTA